MKLFLPILSLIAIVSVSGCTSSEKQASQLLETARFEEKQRNNEHAVKLYQEIVSKHPSTPAAREAAERLKVLPPR